MLLRAGATAHLFLGPQDRVYTPSVIEMKTTLNLEVVGWYTPVFLALKGLRQKDSEFEAGLGYK